MKQTAVRIERYIRPALVSQIKRTKDARRLRDLLEDLELIDLHYLGEYHVERALAVTRCYVLNLDHDEDHNEHIKILISFVMTRYKQQRATDRPSLYKLLKTFDVISDNVVNGTDEPVLYIDP